MKTLSLIGSTGSIGTQVCSVVRRHLDKFKIQSLVANASAETFLKQIEEFRPQFAALVNEEAGRKIADKIPKGVRFVYGAKAAEEGVLYGDVSVIAVTGFAGLKYSPKSSWRINFLRRPRVAISLSTKSYIACGPQRKIE